MPRRIQLAWAGHDGSIGLHSRGWTMPVAIDHDGAVANLYSVGGCPTTVFARPGGRVRETRLGPLTEDDLVNVARRLK